MDLSVNASLISRSLGKTVRRIAGHLDVLKRSFDVTMPHGNTPATLMVSLAYLPRKRFKVIPNRDNIFQVEAGCIDVKAERGLRAGDLIDRAPPEPSDTELLHFLADRILRCLDKCPLEEQDREQYRKIVEEWRRSLPQGGKKIP